MINDGLTISVRELFALFPDANAARIYIESRIWPNGPTCPRCKSTDIVACNTGRKKGVYRCRKCVTDFSVLKGTVFEASKVPLDKWIHGMYLLLTARKGISSLQLSKELSVSQTAAWFLLQRLREACGNDLETLDGVVEIDECFVGGLEDNKHQNKKIKGAQGGNTKSIVLGMRERGGKTRAVISHSKEELAKFRTIRGHVKDGSTVYTDEAPVFRNLNWFYNHETVNHRDGEYHTAKGVGTNSIESVWAVLKRGLHGTYHSASKKHLARYVNEFAFRLNEGNVKTHVLIRLNALVDQCVGKRLTYQNLTA
jgi:transposase-like protein